MRKQPTPQQDSATAINCTMPWRVQKINALDDYKLAVVFMDGTEGLVEMKQRVHSSKAGVFAKLKDVDFFKQVYLHLGVATWPGEIDLAPDAMYKAIKAHHTWILT